MKKVLIICAISLIAAGCNKQTAKVNSTQPVSETKVDSPAVLGATVQSTDTAPAPTPVEAKTQAKIVPSTPPVNQNQISDAVNQALAKQKADQEAQAQADAAAKALADQQADALAKQQADQIAQQEAAALQRQIAAKKAQLDAINAKAAALKSECTDPINALTQQILDIKTQYFKDLQAVENSGGGVTRSFADMKETQLLNDANTKIQDLNNQIAQIRLQCQIKFGN